MKKIDKVLLIALLHDIDDYKLFGKDKESSEEKKEGFFDKLFKEETDENGNISYNPFTKAGLKNLANSVNLLTS